MKKSLVIMLLVLLVAFFSFPVGAEDALSGEEDQAVELCIFLYDKCGGCGVDSPGCGNCQDMVTYHGIIKQQLGDRLYDGTIRYRMLNCRMEANDELYETYYADYGVYESLYGHLPVTFIGREGNGVFLVGEAAFKNVAEVMDAYLSGDNVEQIQQDIDKRYEQATSAQK